MTRLTMPASAYRDTASERSLAGDRAACKEALRLFRAYRDAKERAG